MMSALRGSRVLLVLLLPLLTMAMTPVHAVLHMSLGFNGVDCVAVDRHGTVYVMDGYHLRLVKLSPSGHLLARWGGFTGDEAIGVTVDAQDHVFAGDRGGQRILEFSGTGKRLAAWKVGFAPNFLAVDAQDHLYVADSDGNRIVKISTLTGKRLATWGTLGSDPGQFDYPVGVAVDAHGSVYVVDHHNARIETFAPSGRFLAQFGTAGSAPGQFSHPHSVAVDQHGTIYVGDSANARIQAFSPQGTFLRQWGSQGGGPGQFDGTQSIMLAVGPQGTILAADAGNNRIETFTAQGKLLAIWK